MKEKEINRTSMHYWWPIVSKLDVPMPKTVFVQTSPFGTMSFIQSILVGILEEDETKRTKFEEIVKLVEKAGEEVGYPFFLRTDTASGKHGWKNTAFVMKKADIPRHILNTAEDMELKDILGLSYKSLVIRQWLELDWRFKAFHGEMPVSRERRYFIREGKVQCHHPYWIEEAIEQAHEGEGGMLFGNIYMHHRLPSNWRIQLAEVNTEIPEEINLLMGYAQNVADTLAEQGDLNYYSVDFACGRDRKTWWLIDMAEGERSWHQEGCPFISTRI